MEYLLVGHGGQQTTLLILRCAGIQILAAQEDNSKNYFPTVIVTLYTISQDQRLREIVL